MSKARSHESAVGHVSGSAVYTDDQRRPTGMLSAHPVLSPHARARITRLDISDASRFPGVVTTLTAEDVPGKNDSSAHKGDEPLLPLDEVYYWGQPVAWVIAETEEAARLGAGAVVAEYETLEPLLSIEKAIEADSFHGEAQTIRRGDPQEAIKGAEHKLEGDIFINGQDHFYLETQTSWALPDAEGNMQVYASTQHPTETQEVVAHVLGVPNSHVVVTCLRMGGGFGGKESQANPWAAVAALAAHKTGRPVRVRLRREQDMVMTGKRHPFLGRYRVGFTREGVLEGLAVSLTSDGGWSSDLSLPVMGRAMFHVDNCYFVPHLEVVGRVAKTIKRLKRPFAVLADPKGCWSLRRS